MGSNLPGPDQYAARRDKGLHLPSRLTLLLIALPINIFTLGLTIFRYKYSQIDFPLAMDISILSALIAYYTACLSVLLHSVIMGVRPAAIILILSLSLTFTVTIASFNLITTLFVGLPVSLTAAMDFVCLAPHLPILRNSRARDFIWQHWLREPLLRITQKDYTSSTALDMLPDLYPRTANTSGQLRGRTVDSDLEGAPSTPRIRSLSIQREDSRKDF
ncbi:MAG: hypothetical protein Q9167_003700 [Letrouitia subvulpina]